MGGSVTENPHHLHLHAPWFPAAKMAPDTASARSNLVFVCSTSITVGRRSRSGVFRLGFDFGPRVCVVRGAREADRRGGGEVKCGPARRRTCILNGQAKDVPKWALTRTR